MSKTNRSGSFESLYNKLTLINQNRKETAKRKNVSIEASNENPEEKDLMDYLGMKKDQRLKNGLINKVTEALGVERMPSDVEMQKQKIADLASPREMDFRKLHKVIVGVDVNKAIDTTFDSIKNSMRRWKDENQPEDGFDQDYDTYHYGDSRISSNSDLDALSQHESYEYDLENELFENEDFDFDDYSEQESILEKVNKNIEKVNENKQVEHEYLLEDFGSQETVQSNGITAKNDQHKKLVKDIAYKHGLQCNVHPGNSKIYLHGPRHMMKKAILHLGAKTGENVKNHAHVWNYGKEQYSEEYEDESSFFFLEEDHDDDYVPEHGEHFYDPRTKTSKYTTFPRSSPDEKKRPVSRSNYMTVHVNHIKHIYNAATKHRVNIKYDDPFEPKDKDLHSIRLVGHPVSLQKLLPKIHRYAGISKNPRDHHKEVYSYVKGRNDLGPIGENADKIRLNNIANRKRNLKRRLYQRNLTKNQHDMHTSRLKSRISQLNSDRLKMSAER